MGLKGPNVDKVNLEDIIKSSNKMNTKIYSGSPINGVTSTVVYLYIWLRLQMLHKKWLKAPQLKRN